MTTDDIAGAVANAGPPERRPAPRRRKKISAEIADAVEAINQRHALVLVGDKALVIREAIGEKGRPEIGFMGPDTFRLWHATRKFFNGGRGPMGIGAIWLEHPSRRQYDGICFAPDGAPEGWYNLWKGFEVEPKEADPLKAFPTFRDHLLTNIAGGSVAHFDWIMGWFAHMMQRPAERLGTALVLRGKEGTGKTKVGEVFGSLIARHYLLVDSPRYITGQFNAHLANCLLLQADEGFWAGDRQAEGVLKSLITSSRQMIERKGVDPVAIRNLVRLMVTSNEDWVVPAGLEARRFAVFEIGDGVIQNSEYFAEIDREMENGGREALLWHLLHFPLASVDLRQVPETGALVEQKIMSFKPEVAWWRERLLDGAPTEAHQAWGELVQVKSIYGDYVHYADKLGVKRKMTGEQLGVALRKLLPPGTVRRTREPVTFYRDNSDGSQTAYDRRVWHYSLPPLDECREHFDRLMRTETTWMAETADPAAVPEQPPDG